MDLIDALNSSGDLKTLELLMMYEMLRTENVDLTARAEAAEKMAGQWLKLVTLRDNLIFELEARAEAAEARAEELEARLAWHIIGPPEIPDWYIVEREYREGSMTVTDISVAQFDGDEWIDIKTELPIDGIVIGWRPIA